MIQLHIGGRERKSGWTILNVQAGPGVDILGNCTDLSKFDNGSCSAVYASHVLEHLGYDKDLHRALSEIHRVLESGGSLMLSVPDLDVLSRLFVDARLLPQERFHVMRMMFGGRSDQYDVHLAGLNEMFMTGYLSQAWFRTARRVASFGLI